MSNTHHNEIQIAQYGSGRASIKQVSDALEAAWQDLLKDDDAVETISPDFQMTPAEFRKTFPKSPFKVRPGEFGLGPVEAAIILFVIDVIYDATKEFAKDKAKELLNSVWHKFFKPRVDHKLPIDGFGKEKTSSNNDNSKDDNE